MYSVHSISVRARISVRLSAQANMLIVQWPKKALSQSCMDSVTPWTDILHVVRSSMLCQEQGFRILTIGRLMTLMSDTHIMVEVFKHREMLFALFLFNVSSIQMSKTITKLQKNDNKGYGHYSNKMGSLFFKHWWWSKC